MPNRSSPSVERNFGIMLTEMSQMKAKASSLSDTYFRDLETVSEIQNFGAIQCLK